MLNNIFKLYTKIIKNKKFTYFYALFALFFITYIVSNPENNLTQVIAFLFSFPIVRMLAILKILIIAYYNPPLGLLNVIVMSMILNVEILNKEDFDNLPNLVEKSKIMKYNKNFKEPKKLTTKKVIKKEKTDYEPDEKSEKEVKIKRKIGNVVSRELYNETMEEKEKMENSEKDVEEIDLDLDDDTIEKELKRKQTHEIKKLNEYDDSSSSDSSNSNSSDSSTDSSDSEKEIEEVSMDRARDHMLSNLRKGLKKRYMNKN
jgi:hypothetical protein